MCTKSCSHDLVVDKIGFRQITTVEELISFWPFLQRIAKTNDSEALLRQFLICLQSGLLLAIYTSGQLTSFCTVSRCGDYILIHSLPSDGGKLGRTVLEYVKQWAIDAGVVEVQIVSERLCGSSFRYFEQTLGFHRKAMI